MTRYLLALALVLLLAADLGWSAWSERPYIVTGHGVVPAGEGRAFRVQYTLPGGGEGTWQLPVSSGDSGPIDDCWSLARIGSTIPTCMRSWNEIEKGR